MKHGLLSLIWTNPRYILGFYKRERAGVMSGDDVAGDQLLQGK